MKKKWFKCLLFSGILILSTSVTMARTIDELDFESGQVEEYTQRTYQTDYHVAYVLDENGNRIEVGRFNSIYGHNTDGSSSSTDSWNEGDMTEENAISNIIGSDGTPIDVTEYYKNGQKIFFEPRYSVLVDPAVSNPAYAENGTVTKDVSTGGTKDYWIKESGLTAEELLAKYNWSAATAEGITKQDFEITIEACNHDPYCQHGPNPGGQHNKYTDIRKHVWMPCSKCGGYEKAVCCTHEDPWCQHGENYAHPAGYKISYTPRTCGTCGENYQKMVCSKDCTHNEKCSSHGQDSDWHTGDRWKLDYETKKCSICGGTYSKLVCDFDLTYPDRIKSQYVDGVLIYGSECDCDRNCVGCGVHPGGTHPKWNVVSSNSVTKYECDEHHNYHLRLYEAQVEDGEDRVDYWTDQIPIIEQEKNDAYDYIDEAKEKQPGMKQSASQAKASAEQWQSEISDKQSQTTDEEELASLAKEAEEAQEAYDSAQRAYEQAENMVQRAEDYYNYCVNEFNNAQNSLTRAQQYLVNASALLAKEQAGKCTYKVDNCWLHTCSYEDLGCTGHSYTGKGPAVAGSERWIHATCMNTPSTSNLNFHLDNNLLNAFSLNDDFTLSAQPSYFSHYDLYVKYQDHYLICTRQKLGQCTFIATDGSGDRCPSMKNMGQCGDVSGIKKTYAVDAFDEFYSFANTIDITNNGLGATADIPDTIVAPYLDTHNIDDFIEEELRNSTVPTASIKGTDVIDPRYPGILTTNVDGTSISHIPAPARKTITIDLPVDLIGYNDPSQPLPSVPPANGKSDYNGLSALSVRDLRWMEYAQNGVTFKVPTTDTPIVTTSDPELNEIKMGYAVEFAFRMDNLEMDKTNIKVNPSVIGYSALNDDQQITTPEAKTIYNSRGIEGTEWKWLYYLPYDVLEKNNINTGGAPLTVKFDIEVTDKNGRKLFDYLDYTNSRWTGKVFMYSTEHNLLEDVYNNSAI